MFRSEEFCKILRLPVEEMLEAINQQVHKPGYYAGMLKNLCASDSATIDPYGISLFHYLLDKRLPLTAEEKHFLVKAILMARYAYICVAEPYLYLTRYITPDGWGVLTELILLFNEFGSDYYEEEPEDAPQFETNFRILVKLGADIGLVDQEGETPLDVVHEFGETKRWVRLRVRKIYATLDRPVFFEEGPASGSEA